MKLNDDQLDSESKGSNEDQGIDDSTKQQSNNSKNEKNPVKQRNSGKSRQKRPKESNQVDQLPDHKYDNSRKRNHPGKHDRRRRDRVKRSHIRLPSSINDKLQRDHEVFSLLDAHVFKNGYCSKLATDYFVNEAEMKHNLSTNEFWLIDAVCKSNLETVRDLVYENLDLIQQTLARTNPKKEDIFE